MGPDTIANLAPDVLRWARESTGYSLKDAAREANLERWFLEQVEQGDDLLTLGEAEALAATYQRSLADLFLPAPPAEAPPEVKFRRLRDAPDLPWPSEMFKLHRRIEERQAAAAELLDALDLTPVWPSTTDAQSNIADSALAGYVRQLLAISLDEQLGWRDTRGYKGLRAWIDAVEALGVFVMQDGHLAVDDMRGFASPDATVPVIVLNTKDHPAARAFTLIHELGHLLLDARGHTSPQDPEVWCNRFAGEVIVPPQALVAAFNEMPGIEPERTREVALRFGVTPKAAAFRMASADLVSDRVTEITLRDLEAEAGVWKPKGGDYYRNQIAWLGPAYIRLVLNGAASQAITLSNASGLLDNVKVQNLEKLSAKLDGRDEA